MIKKYIYNPIIILSLVLVSSCAIQNGIHRKNVNNHTPKAKQLEEYENKRSRLYTEISNFKYDDALSQDRALKFLGSCEDFLMLVKSNSYLERYNYDFLAFNHIQISIDDIKHALLNKGKYGIQDTILKNYIIEATNNIKEALKHNLFKGSANTPNNLNDKHITRYYKEVAKERVYTGFCNNYFIKPWVFLGSRSLNERPILSKILSPLSEIFRYFRHRTYPKISKTKQKEFKNIKHQDIKIKTKDGEYIDGLYCLPDLEYQFPPNPYSNANKKVILFLDGTLATMPDKYCTHHKHFRKIDTPCLYIDYRGYGKSTGISTEGGLFLDAEAAFKYLIDLGYSPQNIIVSGYSLGVSPALYLASKYNINCVIAIAGSSSVENRLKKNFFGKIFYTKSDKCLFDNVELVRHTECPIHIIVGDSDTSAPAKENSQIIYDNIPNKKESTFTMIPGGNHGNIWKYKKRCSQLLSSKIKGIVDAAACTTAIPLEYCNNLAG